MSELKDLPKEQKCKDERKMPGVIRAYATFILTLICIVGSLVLGFYKDTDMTILLPALLGIYVGGRTATKASSHMAAAKDETADTAKIIQDTDDR